MKIKLFILSVLTISSISAFSQSGEKGELSFGIRAGLNFQNINGKDAGGNMLKNGLAARYHLGVNLEIPIVPEMYLQPNLLFITKGAKINSIQVNLSYLEVPINFIYKPLLGTGHLMLGFGPYLAYAIGGRVKLNGNTEKITLRNTQSNADQNMVIKPLDAGAGMLFGYEFANKISVQLNVQLGLINIYPANSSISGDKSIYKNTGFGISGGYRF